MSPGAHKSSLAKLVVDDVSMSFKTSGRRLRGAGAGVALDPAGPLRQPDRAVGLRQEHDLQHHRRAARADRRPRADRRHRRHRHHRPCRLHAAEGSAAAVAHGARQCHSRHGNPGRAAASGREARALPLLQRYGLAGFEHLYPNSLSGGMRQRAALLRTLLFDTDVILLDEPFGALDAQTKLQMQEWLMQLWADFGKTVLFVTHDVEEAIYLSDEVHVMGTRPGRVDRDHRDHAAAAAASNQRALAGVHCHQGTLPRTASCQPHGRIR